MSTNDKLLVLALLIAGLCVVIVFLSLSIRYLLGESAKHAAMLKGVVDVLDEMRQLHEQTLDLNLASREATGALAEAVQILADARTKKERHDQT